MGVICCDLWITQLSELCAGDVTGALPPPNAIFAFGDSYLDTGNHNKSASSNRPWLSPYGKTYPGTPSGRYSDGRVFTDVFGTRVSSELFYR